MDSTVYSPLVSRLRESIVGGSFAAGEFIGTERGFAAEYGISRGSVRTGINELRELGLVERRAGKGIYAAGFPAGTGVVEIVVPQLIGMWEQVVLGAQESGQQRGVTLRIYNAHGDLEADLRTVRGLSRNGAQGAIIGSVHQPALAEAIVTLRTQGFPFVCADQHVPGAEMPSVVFDDHTGGYLAGQELLRAGHRRMGFVGFGESGQIGDRLRSFRQALEEGGAPLDPRAAVLHSADELVGPQTGRWETSVRRLLTEPDRVTAIVCQNDQLAAEVYGLAKGMGLRIPRDLSVVGFSDGRLARLLDPPLSMIALPAREMGEVALDMLRRLLRDPATPAEHRVLPVEWAGGESVAPVVLEVTGGV